jgi:F-type H+-transporting ATPase subunit b
LNHSTRAAHRLAHESTTMNLAARAFVLASLTISAVAQAADPAHAAEGDHAAKAGGNPMSFELLQYFATIVTFLIVLAILGKVVWPKILGALDDRDQKIRAEIQAAEDARKQAAAALERYEKSLAEARAEAQQLIEKTKAEQSTFAADLRAKADAELTVLRERATRDIDAAKKQAVSEIYAQAATLATDLASKILKREINAADQRRMIDESIGELEATRN